ncbi:hybrid sensor histidine kinase/response regulator [Leptothoe spongobia]|uniref:histidine kinase n=1 Tax=Leptothoe spongobia TAU-MAC 1115 TaxID=1967444 RepID=A0A947DGE1_9CYAN|nr:hybrid sensor histidine kinase/response regulator [Leptothoe spongobia]MBT9315441.1 hybrid sensor histidine kinase/response regulator [Leptothoe spongobia TAU-MAC 1115]
MTIDPDIRDQAYQFFIEEASELLDIIETGLLNLRPDVSVQKVHEIMRAAHSIKGGAASVDLDTIKTIAHRLEDAFKALYSDMVVVDADLETLLLRAYDCLRHPLQLQIDTGEFNEKQALAVFELIFGELEERLGAAMDIADGFIPSAVDLGVDIVASIFEVDVAEVLARLHAVLANSDDYDCNEELQSQLEILTGFAELVDLPRFTLMMSTARLAASKHCHQPLLVIEQILNDVNNARTTVLTSGKEAVSGPSEILLALAEGEIAGPDDPTYSDVSISGALEDFDLTELDLDALDESINDETSPAIEFLDATTDQVSTLEEIWSIDAVEFPSVERIDEPEDLSSTSDDVDDLEDVWGDADSGAAALDVEVNDFEAVMQESPSAPIIENWSEPSASDLNIAADTLNETDVSDGGSLELVDGESLPSLQDAVSFIGDVYDSLPQLSVENNIAPVTFSPKESRPVSKLAPNPRLSAKVALDRLERMDNLVGELAINRNSLSLQNDQFQRTVRRLGRRFLSFRSIVKQLQGLSDQILISPERNLAGTISESASNAFDSLEMDSYGEINLLLEEVLEEVFQLAESIDDVALFAGQSNQLLERHRLTLTQLRDELMWSRMVPLDQVLKRFPRVIRELSTTYQKTVQLKLIGTDVLVDRVMLEKLYDPLLHLLRNAFDHGIETPDRRQASGKPAEGTIELRAYHQGNYTVIEIGDDGQGLDLESIIERAIAVELVTPEQLTAMPKQQIQHLIFEPGFSTASKISELSGRGMGLDVVKASLQTFNGKLSLTTNPGQGTVFSLKIPLTLTLTKLVVGSVGTTAVAFASDSIEEILRPAAAQLKYSGGKQFLYWRDQLIPVYDLAELLNYRCQVPEQLPQELQEGQTIQGQNIMLIIQQGQGQLALSLEQIVTEQELVIKPMGKAIAAPDYINGCTVLADGSLVPVIDGGTLVQFDAGPAMPTPVWSQQPKNAKTLMIVDDSSALRRTLALTLRKAGYQVLQAKDGRDAVEQLQRGALPHLIICDVEMPRLNGFEFLSQRRANLTWAKIPTVMLTSRGNHKHQTLAKHLGANEYFTKPYIEKEFVGAIATLLE